ncbi:MAG: SRPBCC family protein [Stappiaceae bacterium]
MNIWNVVAGGTGLLAIAVIGSFLLPRHIHVERQATLTAAPEVILELATSNKGYQRFNPYVSSDPDLKIRPFGPDEGIGSGFKFEGREGKGQQIVAAITKNSVRYDIDLGSMGNPKQTITAKAEPNGTHVIWSMDADLGMNPIARVFGLFMDGMVGPTLERGLSNLDTAT